MNLSHFLLIFFIFSGLHGLTAAESANDLLGSVRATREAAETQLTQSRARIEREQVALLQRLQDAVNAQNAARDRLVFAEQATKSAKEDLVKQRFSHDKEQAETHQRIDNILVAAGLGSNSHKQLQTASPIVRVEAAITAVHNRMAALTGRCALTRGNESIIGRNGQAATVAVLRLGQARAVAIGEHHHHRGLLQRSADNREWLVVGPELPPIHVSNGQGAILIPLDITGNAVLQPANVKRSFGQWLAAGGFFIWPIIAVLAIGLGIIIERLVALARCRVDARQWRLVAARLIDNDVDGARRLVNAAANPLNRVLRVGLQDLDKPRLAREAAVESALLAETGQLSRGLSAIGVLAGVAPLLGLLGTVTGMIDMFAVISASGTGKAASLSSGISEALICTQAGMVVAIPLLLAHAWLGRLADKRTQLLEEAACGVLGLDKTVGHAEPQYPIQAPVSP